jgi:uncharacterized protein (DUF2249 family)
MDMQLPISDAREAGETPALNAIIIPHPLRHGAIHGALGSRRVGESMILIAPHDPLPLLEEVKARAGTFTVTYLQKGPHDWRLKFTRTA